jgi:hypothetical protein
VSAKDESELFFNDFVVQFQPARALLCEKNSLTIYRDNREGLAEVQVSKDEPTGLRLAQDCQQDLQILYDDLICADSKDNTKRCHGEESVTYSEISATH